MGLEWLVFLIRHLYSVVLSFIEDQKNKHHKDASLNEIEQHLQKLITTLHSIMNTTWKTNIFTKKMIKHALPITITKSGEVRFSIRVVQMFHCRDTNAT